MAYEVFDMRPFSYEECDCAEDHVEGCHRLMPNFRHKRTGLEITWYKWIGRGDEMSRSVERYEWNVIAAACMASLDLVLPQ